MKYAEDVGHYWKTGTTAPDTWIDKATKVIEEIGGTILAEGFGNAGGKAAYMLTFGIKEQVYKVIWPVLPSSAGNEKAAKIQAATMLYHDVKAKAMAASVLGTEMAFFSYALLPDGRQISQVAFPELAAWFPKLVGAG